MIMWININRNSLRIFFSDELFWPCVFSDASHGGLAWLMLACTLYFSTVDIPCLTIN